jgi:hypothetical protein
MYCIGIMFSKFSILFLFMKVFVPVREGLVYWANLLLICTNALFYIGGVGGLLCQCIPRAKISNPTLPGRCTNVYLSFMLSGIWNVLSDFFILNFPLWAVWHLQMPLKRKFGITIVFATGVLYGLPPPLFQVPDMLTFVSLIVPSSQASCVFTPLPRLLTIRT